MNSQSKFSRLLVALGVVLLLGVSAIGPRLPSDQRLARLKPADRGHVATQRERQPSSSESRERSAWRQASTQHAPLPDKQQAQRQSTAVSHPSPSHAAGIKVSDTGPERIELAAALPAAELEEQERTGLEEREPRPDQPDEAARFRRLQMQDEKGFIPPDGLEKARQHVALMKAAQQERRKARQGAPKSPQEIEAAGIAPDAWSWLGPGNIGGRIRSIVIHPTNTNTMWVGSVSGGIWRTDNGGVSWFPVNDFLANLAVSTMVINPTNPNIMYAGTGEGFSNIDAIRGAGVFQSTDGGVTWSQLASTANANWFYVNRLAISPNGNTVLAATNSGIWRSTDGGASWNPGGGVVGTSLDIDFHPTDNQRAIASGNGAAVFSTDGGQSWPFAAFRINATDPPTPISGRVEVAYAPSNPSTVYASVNQNNGDIYRSTDGGQNYTRMSTGTNFFLGAVNQGGYDNIIWVNPQNANFVIVGGIGLWLSTDGGTTLNQISAGANTLHADQHMIVAHPGFNNTTNRTVFFSNDGGIYRADDVATVGQIQFSRWDELNNNLGITQFYGAAGNPITGVIVGGTQDNGTVKFTGGTESWTSMFGGDGGYSAADPTDSDSNTSHFYGEYTNLGIVRSINGGASSSYIYCNPAPTNPNGGVCTGVGITDAFNGANFIAPFILDPNNANTMLAGGLSLWRSTDVRDATLPAWTVIKTAYTIPQPPPNPPAANPVSAIAISPSNSDLIVVGHNNGDIWITFDGKGCCPPTSPIWTKISNGTPPRFVTRLAIDSTRSPTWIYATFGGFSSNNVYRTTDLGTTWTDVTGAGATGLPSVPVRSLVIHPRNSNLLYVGTEVGVFSSDDAGASWSLPQDGPANVSVDELFWMGGDLIAATHGRGLYRASGGVYVDCNYNGIPFGSFDRPFKTIAAAVNFAPPSATIWIKPCNYNETFPMLNKRLELRSLGGTINIGKP